MSLEIQCCGEGVGANEMVKGNWERRAELAQIRRAEGRLAKEEKKLSGGKKSIKICGESAVMKLLSFHIGSDVVLTAWLDLKRSLGRICSANLRLFEGCSIKRCRLPHSLVSVGHLRQVPIPTEFSSASEVELDNPVPLVSVSGADYARIRFLAVGSRCVFDWANADLWQSYAQELDSAKCVIKSSIGATVLSKVAENSDESDGEHGIDILDETEKLIDLHVRNDTTCIFETIINQHPRALLFCFAALTLTDVAQLTQCNSGIRRAMFSVSRYKELKSVMATEYARRRQDEKRKRHKQAFVGNDSKVDAFARGGGGR